MKWITVPGNEFIRYPFLENDGGRSQSRRPKQSNDCTVRALAIACEKPYDDVYGFLRTLGRECGRRFNMKILITPPRGRNGAEIQTFLGAKLVWRSFPAVKGQRRMNPVQFTLTFTRGRFICRTAKHVFAVIDGVVYDTEPESADRCIYGAWAVERLPQ